MWSLFIYQNWIRKLPLSHIPVPMYSSILSITLVILSIKYSCSPTVLFNQSSQLDDYYYIVQISREFDRGRLCRQLTSFGQSVSQTLANMKIAEKVWCIKVAAERVVVGWKTPNTRHRSCLAEDILKFLTLTVTQCHFSVLPFLLSSTSSYWWKPILPM